jgi:hypothetical protein
MIIVRTLTACLLGLLLSGIGLADPASISFQIENDGLAGPGDRYYTSGLLLAVSHSGIPGWLPYSGRPEGESSWAWELGQVITTPRDVSLGKPHPGDRPYAGMLFLAGSLQLRQGAGLDRFEVSTGIVGPAAGGRFIQNLTHELLGTSEAGGWDHQLGQEVLLNLAWEHRHRVGLMDRPSGWGADLVAVGGAAVGNMLTRGRAGLLLQWGYRLPDDFGRTLLRDTGHLRPAGRGGFGFRAHAGICGTLSLHDITIDGNTFRDSPSADRRPFFAEGELGLALTFRRFELAYTVVITGREFEAQQGNDYFGAFSIATRF